MNMIKVCKKHGETPHRNESKKSNHWRCCKCASEAVARKRKQLKIDAIKYLGGSCKYCGYSKCVSALEFHHRDPSKKEFGISMKGYTKSWESIRVELDKCDLVCSNCHKEIHENLKTPVAQS
jgi:hypothetical protein